MKISATRIPDVLVIEPRVFDDERGFFMETWHRQRFAEHGLDWEFVQDNHSRSVRGTLRGLHYQVVRPQGKLVRVVVGEVFDVAVDLRKRSPTFGQWVARRLSADNRLMIWIPPGFAHGFYVMSEFAECEYKCTDYYSPEHERTIRWDDRTLGIDWPLDGPVILSEKDRAAPSLDAAECFE
jgi:dTDP-4-dehydrorhamnose 3,5-epimerase